MANDLSELKITLDQLKQEIGQRRTRRKLLEEKNPHLSAQSENGMDPWEREEAYCWIFADMNYIPLMERAIDGAFVVPAIPDLKALSLFNAWKELNRDVLRYEYKRANPKTFELQRGNYVIHPPRESQSLYEYLTEVSRIIAAKRGCKDSVLRSLRSFLAYLRVVFKSKEIGFIESIFPKHMDVEEFVVRKIQANLFPIDIYSTAHILQNLSAQILSGPENAQHVAAQALAFCWICLYSAHARLRSEEKVLHMILKRNLKPPSYKIVNPWADHDYPTLILPSFFGEVEILISCPLEKFLRSMASPDSERIFSSPLPSLRRVLDRAVNRVPDGSDIGKISFLTMTSFPYEL